MRINKKLYFASWLLASLIGPIIVLLGGILDHNYSIPEETFILIIWPSSIFLMALNSYSTVAHEINIFLQAMGINIILYLGIGYILLIPYIFFKKKAKT